VRLPTSTMGMRRDLPALPVTHSTCLWLAPGFAQVHFLGPRPISTLDGLFRRADVLVSPRLKGLNTPMKMEPRASGAGA
jgi:hypothetical protein